MKPRHSGITHDSLKNGVKIRLLNIPKVSLSPYPTHPISITNYVIFRLAEVTAASFIPHFDLKIY